MKDVSVTLGKIEERFGEKLNSLNDKISHLSLEKEEKSEELQTVEDEKQKVIDELLDKAKLDATQKEAYIATLREKEAEAESLRRQLQSIDMKYRHMMRRHESVHLDNESEFSSNILTKKEVYFILNRLPDEWPDFLKKKMFNWGIITKDYALTPEGKIFVENLKNNS